MEHPNPVNRRAPGLNPKSEIRNAKQLPNFPNPNDQNRVKGPFRSNVLNIGEFLFQICLVLCAQDFEFEILLETLRSRHYIAELSPRLELCLFFQFSQFLESNVESENSYDIVCRIANGC